MLKRLIHWVFLFCFLHNFIVVLKIKQSCVQSYEDRQNPARFLPLGEDVGEKLKRG
jgi:hypothetical protein